ncbi:MAG: STAS domain-containing protein [Burkholderiales bacterium]|nr:STAS domain-containing protein [Burkholderiales bacterium]
MIQVEGSVLKLSGPVTIETHVAVRDSAAPHIGQADWAIDWAGVSEVDSSALSLIFAWLRASQAQGQTIRNVNLPANLKSLAELYGVAELLPA